MIKSCTGILVLLTSFMTQSKRTIKDFVNFCMQKFDGFTSKKSGLWQNAFIYFVCDPHNY